MKYDLKTVGGIFFRKFLCTYWIKLHYLVCDIESRAIADRMAHFDLPVRQLSYSDFLCGNKDYYTEIKLDLYKKRMGDSNYVPYGIFENNRLIYSCWISMNKIGLPIEVKPIYLSSNEGYLEDDYCDPIVRGRGIHSKMVLFRINELSKRKRTKVITIVMDGNVPALKASINNGFRDVGTFYTGRIFGIKFVTLNKRKYESR